MDVFLARPGIDHQQKIVLIEPVNDHVIHKRAFWIKHRRILRLADDQFRRIVHADVLYRCQRSAGFRAAADSNVAHVANVENAHADAHRLMLGDQPAARRILDGHIPAAKINHLCAQPAVQRI